MKKLFSQDKDDNEGVIFPIINKKKPITNHETKSSIIKKTFEVHMNKNPINIHDLNHNDNINYELQEESISSRLKRLEAILDETGLKRLDIEKEQKLQQLNALDNQIKAKQAQLDDYEKTLKKFEDESVENYRKKIQAYNLKFNTDLINK